MTAANEKPDCPCCGSHKIRGDQWGLQNLKVCENCNCGWNEDKRRAQTAEGVDDAEYTQGLAYDGVVILKDGQPITIDEVLAMLNARSGAVDDSKECKAAWNKAFTGHQYGEDETHNAMHWFITGWYARARGGN